MARRKEEFASTTGKYAQMDFYELTNGSEPEPPQQNQPDENAKEEKTNVCK